MPELKEETVQSIDDSPRDLDRMLIEMIEGKKEFESHPWLRKAELQALVEDAGLDHADTAIVTGINLYLILRDMIWKTWLEKCREYGPDGIFHGGLPGIAFNVYRKFVRVRKFAWEKKEPGVELEQALVDLALTALLGIVVNHTCGPEVVGGKHVTLLQERYKHLTEGLW